MVNAKPHIGFSENDTPVEVVWSNRSFVKPVRPMDKRNLGVTKLTILYTSAVLLFPAAIILAVFYYTRDLRSIIFSPLVIVCFISIACAVLLNIFSPLLMKWISIYKIKIRSELLFQPDRNANYVTIEKPETFFTKKKTAVDFGLLRVTPEFVQLEMSKYHAQFENENLSASFVSDDNVPWGICLTHHHEQYPWSVVISPVISVPIASFNGRLKRLMDKLKKAGILEQTVN